MAKFILTSHEILGIARVIELAQPSYRVTGLSLAIAPKIILNAISSRLRVSNDRN